MEFESRQAHIKAEKAKGRELRNSQWWKNKVQGKNPCHYCQSLVTADEVTMDHLVPLSRGGKSVKGNVVICCKTCNTQKADSTPVEMILQSLS